MTPELIREVETAIRRGINTSPALTAYLHLPQVLVDRCLVAMTQSGRIVESGLTFNTF
jgi:hypothetical protein